MLILNLVKSASSDNIGLSLPFIRSSLKLNVEITKKQLYLLNKEGLLSRKGVRRLYHYFITDKGVQFIIDNNREDLIW